MKYFATNLKQEISITRIYTIHYFEYAKDYIFKGEKHNFWELVYVDKGEIEVIADTSGYKLRQGEMIFHKPGEFHNLWANGTIAPNLIIVSFECNSQSMKFFEGKILKGDNKTRDFLSEIITEARNAYSSPLDDTYLKKLKKIRCPVFASEQLIRLNLELLLISFIRKSKTSTISKSAKLSPITKQRYDNERIDAITNFLKQNIYKDINFTDVCKFSSLSGTNLKQLFRDTMGKGVMSIYNDLRIEEAKRLIRERPMTFTDISDKLSYTSVHYFSRHFKKATGMTPTQYATSVKARQSDS